MSKRRILYRAHSRVTTFGASADYMIRDSGCSIPREEQRKQDMERFRQTAGEVAMLCAVAVFCVLSLVVWVVGAVTVWGWVR